MPKVLEKVERPGPVAPRLNLRVACLALRGVAVEKVSVKARRVAARDVVSCILDCLMMFNFNM